MSYCVNKTAHNAGDLMMIYCKWAQKSMFEQQTRPKGMSDVYVYEDVCVQAHVQVCA